MVDLSPEAKALLEMAKQVVTAADVINELRVEMGGLKTQMGEMNRHLATANTTAESATAQRDHAARQRDELIDVIESSHRKSMLGRVITVGVAGVAGIVTEAIGHVLSENEHAKGIFGELIDRVWETSGNLISFVMHNLLLATFAVGVIVFACAVSPGTPVYSRNAPTNRQRRNKPETQAELAEPSSPTNDQVYQLNAGTDESPDILAELAEILDRAGHPDVFRAALAAARSDTVIAN